MWRPSGDNANRPSMGNSNWTTRWSGMGGEPAGIRGRINGRSVDGRVLAFNGISGGRDEVYVAPLPPTGQRWQVSTQGGVQAHWHPDGRTLYYLDPEGTMMAVSVTPGAAFSAGAPRPLFDVGFIPTRQFDDYRIGPDGQFFVKRPAPGVVRVIVNWPALLGDAGAR